VPDGVLGPAYRVTTVAILTLVSLIAFEALATSTAMPVAATALGGVSSYGLAFASYFATSLIGVVAAGGWTDARGPRAPVLAALGLFAAGLLVAGTATAFPVLLAGRAVSGLGGGLLGVSIYVVVADVYPQALQPRVFGALSAAWVLPGIIGPAVAGWVTTHVSWRAVFLGVLPFAALLLPVLLPRLRSVPLQEGEDRHRILDGRFARGVLLAAGALTIQLGVDVGGPWAWGLVPAGGVLLLVALPGLVPPGALRLRRGLPALVAVRALFTGTFAGTEAFVPLMLVAHRGITPALAGAVLTSGTLGWSLGSFLQGSARVRLERVTLLSLAGAVLGLGVLGLALTPLGSAPAWLVPLAWILAATGMGTGMSSMNVLTLRLSPTGEEGRSSSALQLGDALGSLLGIGVAGALFSAAHAQAAQAAPYVLVWGVLGFAGLAASLVARRVRTAVPGSRPGLDSVQSAG
jgi:MFS family permease